MGFSRNSCTNPIESLHASFSSKIQTLGPTGEDEYCENYEFDDYEVKFKSLLYKMIWGLGLNCIIPHHRR